MQFGIRPRRLIHVAHALSYSKKLVSRQICIGRRSIHPVATERGCRAGGGGGGGVRTNKCIYERGGRRPPPLVWKLESACERAPFKTILLIQPPGGCGRSVRHPPFVCSSPFVCTYNNNTERDTGALYGAANPPRAHLSLAANFSNLYVYFLNC